MDTFATEPIGLAVVAISVVVVILFIWCVRLSMRLSRVNKQYHAMMNGQGVDNLEQVIGDLQRRMHAREAEGASASAELKRINEAMRLIKGKVGIVRYNAFQGQGNDLSFSVAIVNDLQDGVVLSGIHNREETYVYAKPLAKGESTYPLTPEERNAINLAGQL